MENDWREPTVKKEMVAIGRRLWERGLVAANDGNISARLGENEFLITPTGVSKGFMKTEQILRVDPKGRVIAGDGRPSTEILMHLEVYRQRPDINAAVHAHPPFAVTMAVAGEALDQKILTESVVLTGEIPLTPFATPSTPEVAENLRPYLADHDLFLLEFHGALTLGKSLEEAYLNMERLEYCARITWNLKTAGIFREMNEEQLAKLYALRDKLRGK